MTWLRLWLEIEMKQPEGRSRPKRDPLLQLLWSGSCHPLLSLTTKSTAAIEFVKREGRRPFADGESSVSPDISVVGLLVPSTFPRVTCFLPQFNQQLSLLVD